MDNGFKAFLIGRGLKDEELGTLSRQHKLEWSKLFQDSMAGKNLFSYFHSSNFKTYSFLIHNTSRLVASGGGAG